MPWPPLTKDLGRFPQSIRFGLFQLVAKALEEEPGVGQGELGGRGQSDDDLVVGILGALKQDAAGGRFQRHDIRLVAGDHLDRGTSDGTEGAGHGRDFIKLQIMSLTGIADDTEAVSGANIQN